MGTEPSKPPPPPPPSAPSRNKQTTPVASSNKADNISPPLVVPQASEQQVRDKASPSDPVGVITKQTYSEALYIIRGKDQGCSAWHYILVPYDKINTLKEQKSELTIDITEFGCIVQYLNRAGDVCTASGWGEEPPEKLKKWIEEQYGPCAVDENVSLIYTTDDIRLCIMQRSVPEQRLGVFLYFHKHEHFHYFKLFDDFQSTLAFRAGIKSFDRVIEYNGINVEADSAEDFSKRFDNARDQPVELLVCSPATYAHYKKNGKQLHSNLEAVKHLNPVRDTIDRPGAATDEQSFCAIRWDGDRGVDVVPVSSVLQKPELIQLHETYTVEINGWQRKGTIVFRGTKSECESLKTGNSSRPVTTISAERKILNNPEEINTDIFVTAIQEPLTSNECNSVATPKKANGLPGIPEETNDSAEKNNNEKKIKGRERQAKLMRHLMTLLMDEMNKPEDGAEVHRVQCNGCGSLRIRSDRYKCLECHNYDLCGICFDERRETLKHISGHAVVHFSDPGEVFGEPTTDSNTTITLNKFKEKYVTEEHTDVQCNNCKITPIKGLRFKCDTCHDYNLCLACMEKRLHDKSHPLIVIGKERFTQIPVNDIELNDELGRGGFGIVYKAKWISKNRQVACKVISVPPDKQHLEKSFRKELAAYAELSGPYILKTYGYNVQELPNGIRKCMLVMEFMSRGSLASVLKQEEKVSLRRKLDMACQVASGMRKLHAHRMIHRDIRPDNILVTQNYTAKIGDMGLARVWMPDDNLTLAGCMGYMPFEFYTGKYDQSLDIYTFGLTLNELFTEKRHQANILTRRIKLTCESPVFSDLINRCIHFVTSQRPSAIEVETTLQMYKQAFEKYVVQQHIEYTDMSPEERNSTFVAIYAALHPDIDQILKDKFPRPPPPPARRPEEAAAAAADLNTGEINILRFLELLQQLGDR